MPTVLRIDGYRFHFYGHESNEPSHVRVDRAEFSAKLWLDPVALARNEGYRTKELGIIIGHVREHRPMLLEAWHRYFGAGADERVSDLRFEDERLVVDLMDGRTIAVPVIWYPRLVNATEAQRSNWQRIGAGYDIHWPDIDENLSTEGLLRGAPAPGWQAS